MDLSTKLVTIQVGGVLTYFGVAFALYKIYIETLKERISQKDDEIAALKASHDPEKLQALVSLIETANKKEIERLEREKQDAIREGNKAVEAEKAEKIRFFTEAALANIKLHEKVEEFQRKEKEAEEARKAIHDALASMRQTVPIQETMMEYLRRLGNRNLGLGDLRPNCLACYLSQTICKNCRKPYCSEHRPSKSLGFGPDFTCGDCVTSTLYPAQ